MHYKKSEVQIGKESVGISSDFNPSPPLLSPPSLQKKHHFDPISASLRPPKSSPTWCRPPRPPPEQQRLSRFAAHSAALRRILSLLTLPLFYFVLSHPTRSFILDFISAFSFFAALLLSLNLAIPRVPYLRLFLSRFFSIKLLVPFRLLRPSLPLFWHVVSRPWIEREGRSGFWVHFYSNGDVYEGEFRKGKFSGSGVYYYYMSGKYEGEWGDGMYDGSGVETWARGSWYRGQYRRGLRHGYGVYRFYTGDVYSGQWLNGQSHGCGVHTSGDGSRYVGEFRLGVKHGLGHYFFRNGDRYAGDYFQDKIHGFGTYKFGNGDGYEGAWGEGKRNGLGIYTFRNGESQCGQWRNGFLGVPSTQNCSIHPISPAAVYHSKVLNAVQESREAADKAYKVDKVDERVSRAVGAANRAASAARVAAVQAVQLKDRCNSHHILVAAK